MIKALAEGVGTAFLLIAVVGSGIMGEQLASGNVAIALLANSIATGCALIALINTFGPISGAHFNPVVTITIGLRDKTPITSILQYIIAQCTGAIVGVLIAHAMFSMQIFELSTKDRSGLHFLIGEFVATLGLLGVILSCDKFNTKSVPYSVAAYITGAYWFTSSTSFANPAVTIARTLTESFAGIRWQDAPLFICAQVAAMILLVAVTLNATVRTKNSECISQAVE